MCKKSGRRILLRGRWFFFCRRRRLRRFAGERYASSSRSGACPSPILHVALTFVVSLSMRACVQDSRGRRIISYRTHGERERESCCSLSSSVLACSRDMSSCAQGKGGGLPAMQIAEQKRSRQGCTGVSSESLSREQRWRG